MKTGQKIEKDGLLHSMPMRNVNLRRLKLERRNRALLLVMLVQIASFLGQTHHNLVAVQAVTCIFPTQPPVKKCNFLFPISAVEIRRVAARLVSYNNDEAMSDDDDDDDEEDSNSRVEFPVIRASRPVTPDVEQLLPGEELLPPEPTGKCPADLQERIETMLKKKIDMNFSIQQRKQFRNPSIYEKLIEHLGIEEKGTNYPIVIS